MRALKTMIHSLDAWLWRRGIDHPVIRPLVRNEMLLTGIFCWAGRCVHTDALVFLVRRGRGDYDPDVLELGALFSAL